jgi:hypothetical protein
MAHFLEYLQQMLEGFEAERCATHAARVELQIGGRDGHQALDVRTQPDHATATEVRLIRDANKRQGTPAQGMAGVDDGDGLLGRECATDRGTVVVGVSRYRWAP